MHTFPFPSKGAPARSLLSIFPSSAAPHRIFSLCIGPAIYTSGEEGSPVVRYDEQLQWRSPSRAAPADTKHRTRPSPTLPTPLPGTLNKSAMAPWCSLSSARDTPPFGAGGEADARMRGRVACKNTMGPHLVPSGAFSTWACRERQNAKFSFFCPKTQPPGPPRPRGWSRDTALSYAWPGWLAGLVWPFLPDLVGGQGVWPEN